MASTIGKYLVQMQDATQIAGIYAYRGQHDSQWLLHSAATRRLVQEHGTDALGDTDFPQMYINYHRDTLIDPARIRGFCSESGRRLSDLEVLAKLQHFGAATGLLDFTWNPLVALWFACEDATRDGKLFAVNTNDPILVARVSTDETAQTTTAVFSPDAGSFRLSYWEPTLSGDASARILRQRSVFIVDRPLSPLATDVMNEVIVGQHDKVTLRHELASLDLHEESLFQDVYGFAQASARSPVPRLTAGAYQRRGNRHYQRGEYTEAILAYSQALQLGPAVGATYFLRANARSASGNHHEAIEDYDRAAKHIETLPRELHFAVYFNRGNSKAALPNHEDPLDDYTKAVTLQPDLAQGYYNRGNAYMDLYRFEEAIDDYDQVKESPPRHASANRALALIALGRLSEARRAYVQALEKGLDDEAVLQNVWALGQIMALVGDLDQTVKARPDPDTGTMSFRFEVPREAEEARKNLGRFLFRGRAGNTGNTGAPGLAGGEGHEGKPAIRVYVDVR